MNDVCGVNIPVPGVPFNVPSTDGTYQVDQVDPTRLTLLEGIFKGTWVPGGHYFPSNMVVDSSWLLWLCIYENSDFFQSGPNWAVLFDLKDSAGPTGPQGLPGPQGPQGSQGIQGIQGPAGTNGVDGAPGGVASFQGRTGAVTLLLTDVTGVGGAPNDSPAFTGSPTAPTQAPGDNDTSIATTAFVNAAVTAMNVVASFNTRKGAVVLTLSDVTGAGGAPLASPTFSGSPTAPTPGAGDNSTKLATTAFVQSKVSGLYLPLTGGTVTGGLTVQGTLQGAVIAASTNIQVNVAASANALLYLQGARSWYVGSMNNSQFYITDNSAGVARLIIDTAGRVTVPGSLTVSGAFNTNAISGTTITATASNGIQCVVTGASAWFRSLVQNVRDWYCGCNTDGNWYTYDASAGATRFLIDTGGNATLYQSLTIGANLQVNGSATINGNSFTRGQLHGGTLLVDGGSTQTGQISCNAISCSTINTNGNVITCGAVSASGNITAGNMNAGANGLAYNRVNGGLYFEFGSSGGTNLVFYTQGVARGTWNFNNASDERIKKNIADAEGDALAELNGVRLISFDETGMRDSRYQPTHLAFGFSAQQMEAVIPEAVNRVKVEPEGTDDELLLTIDIMPLLARCIGAIQTLSTKVASLEARLAA
jgi:Chaperone of endosialidase